MKIALTTRFVFFFFALSLTTLATQVGIPGPAGSGAFGSQVIVLPNGNIVVADPGFDEGGVNNIGAVYLYDGATLALISTLKGGTAGDQVGGGGITVLANGNFLIPSGIWDNPSPVRVDVGAITFCSGTTGCNGVVSAANSLIGSTASEFLGGGITPLPNGNYIVRESDWDKPAPPSLRANAGAVTFCDGTIGCTGEINAGNSLIGAQADDQIGSIGITVLSDGDYVVNSPLVNGSPFADIGAVTFCSVTTGCTGEVSVANSLVGQRGGEKIGTCQVCSGTNGVTALANGNYAVASGLYNPNSAVDPNPVGAVTFCNGVTGCTGTIPTNTSLVGSANRQSVGILGATALPNGNYVVNSPIWDNGLVEDVGAVTFCDGTIGCSGNVHPGNSLIGSTAFDNVGNAGNGLVQAVNPVTVLSDGNYVINTPNWDKSGLADVGAVTWCSGTTGCAGPVTPTNSLTGSTASDWVGGLNFGSNSKVAAVGNGKYVVSSPFWNKTLPTVADVGAVTLCDGTTNSCANQVVSSDNSLVGATASDQVGASPITAVTVCGGTSGYVVRSTSWDNVAISNAGAITFCNSATGCTGTITSSNSLIGSRANDFLGSTIAALPSGAYAAVSPGWDNGAAIIDAGAVTFCNGPGGCTGTVSSSNSLIGSKASDQIGNFGVTILSNGHYLVASPNWDNGTAVDVGSVTFCNGTTGCNNTVSASNSLIGTTASDQVGNAVPTNLPNGHYIVRSSNWDNGGIANAGAVTFGNGVGGTTGFILSDNSSLGQNVGFLTFSYDTIRNRVVVGHGASNLVGILFFETNAVADGNLSDPATWSGGVPNALTNVTIPAGRNITVDAAATIGALGIENGGNLIMNADLSLTGNLDLGTQISTGSNTLALSCASTIFGASSLNYIIGNLKKDFCSTGAFSYPTGTASGYSPVNATVTGSCGSASATTATGSLTIKANQGNRTGMNSAQSAQRFWTLTETGDLTTNLVFNYLDADVAGDESTYKLFKWNGPTSTPVAFVLDTSTNTISASGISSFSDWAIGNLAPTAASVSIVGRVMNSEGRGLANASVSLSNKSGESRTVQTSLFGYYYFHNVPTGETYVISVAAKRYQFSPRVVTVTDALNDLNFTPE